MCACACVLRIMACLFICRLTPVRPLQLIRAPASLFRSPPSWLVMKTLLLKRQVLCLKASNALCCDFTGGHIEAYPISMTGINHQIPLVVSPNQHLMSFCLSYFKKKTFWFTVSSFSFCMLHTHDGHTLTCMF